MQKIRNKTEFLEALQVCSLTKFFLNLANSLRIFDEETLISENDLKTKTIKNK